MEKFLTKENQLRFFVGCLLLPGLLSFNIGSIVLCIIFSLIFFASEKVALITAKIYVVINLVFIAIGIVWAIYSFNASLKYGGAGTTIGVLVTFAFVGVLGFYSLSLWLFCTAIFKYLKNKEEYSTTNYKFPWFIILGILFLVSGFNNVVKKINAQMIFNNQVNGSSQADNALKNMFNAKVILRNELPQFIHFTTEKSCPNSGKKNAYIVPQGFKCVSCRQLTGISEIKLEKSN